MRTSLYGICKYTHISEHDGLELCSESSQLHSRPILCPYTYISTPSASISLSIYMQIAACTHLWNPPVLLRLLTLDSFLCSETAFIDALFVDRCEEVCMALLSPVYGDTYTDGGRRGQREKHRTEYAGVTSSLLLRRMWSAVTCLETWRTRKDISKTTHKTDSLFSRGEAHVQTVGLNRRGRSEKTRKKKKKRKLLSRHQAFFGWSAVTALFLLSSLRSSAMLWGYQKPGTRCLARL